MNGSGGSSTDDTLVLLLLGTLGLGAAGAVLATGWDRALAWLLEHQVLLPGSAQPLLAVPGAGGAGLDLPRITIGVAALLLLATVAVGALRRRAAGRTLQ